MVKNIVELIKAKIQHSAFIIHNSRSAFTLVELIVTISISVLLTTMLVLYTKTGEKQLTLFVERSKILGVITQAKTLAIQTLSNPAGEIPCGYGVYFNPPTYFIFKNNAQIGKDSSGDLDCNKIKKKDALVSIYDPARDPIVGEPFTLTKGVIFSPMAVPQIILFIAPDPTVILSPIDAGKQTVTIETDDTQSRQAKITINDFGQITF